MKIIKKSRHLSFCAIAVCLSISSVTVHTAIASTTGWKLPINPGNSLTEDLDAAILSLTNWLLGFTLAVSVLALIWGGLNYVSCSGDAQKADLSKKIIYYALIGVLIAGVSYAIVNVIVIKIL